MEIKIRLGNLEEAFDYYKELKDSGFDEVCVHDSAFRLFNSTLIGNLP